MSIESTKLTVQSICHKVDISLLLLYYSATVVTSFVINCDCFIRVYSRTKYNNLDDCSIRLNQSLELIRT